MEKKNNNPVEGRLGIPSLTRTEPHTKFTKRNTNYGVERLGITSDTESNLDEPISELSEKQKTPPSPTDTAQPITVSPVSKKITEQAESAEAVEPEHRYAISSKLSRYKNILGRRKIKILLLLTGIPVMVMTLILWFCLGVEETVPQSASATHITEVASKPSQNSPEIAKRPTKPEPKVSPASPTTEKMRQHPESGQEISATTPVRSTLREIFNFLAEMKPAPETTAAVPAQAAPPPKPDKPQESAPKPVVKRALAVASASSRLGIRLVGIMRGSNGRIALINNRSVRVGQTVNDAKVVHIGDFSIEVELKDQRYIIGISSPQPQNTSDRDEDESSDSGNDKSESKTE